MGQHPRGSTPVPVQFIRGNEVQARSCQCIFGGTGISLLGPIFTNFFTQSYYSALPSAPSKPTVSSAPPPSADPAVSPRPPPPPDISP